MGKPFAVLRKCCPFHHRNLVRPHLSCCPLPKVRCEAKVRNEQELCSFREKRSGGGTETNVRDLCGLDRMNQVLKVPNLNRCGGTTGNWPLRKGMEGELCSGQGCEQRLDVAGGAEKDPHRKRWAACRVYTRESVGSPSQ